MTQEKLFKPISGYIMIVVVLVLLALGAYLLLILQHFLGIFPLVLGLFLATGFFIVNPNQSMVLILFGAYKGTVKENGFCWANPFFVKNKISLRARNFDSKPIKVNDKIGNPIMVGAVLVWQVQDTYKAAFDVDDFQHFVLVQSDAAMRKLAGDYPYDEFEDTDDEISLRAGGAEVNHELEEEMRKRLAIAGIKVIEARINYLAYASEIASAMLQRQQATAIIAARQKIVEGAVGMVEMALEELSQKNIIELDDDKKAAMVSNLMVVLCSEGNVTPVVNAGTLYQ
jgi:regulator of protease activity HflC (stomatin/prohibitin superfamily)